MKVKATDKHPYVASGSVLDVTPKDADMLITRGYAVAYKEPKPEKVSQTKKQE